MKLQTRKLKIRGLPLLFYFGDGTEIFITFGKELPHENMLPKYEAQSQKYLQPDWPGLKSLERLADRNS